MDVKKKNKKAVPAYAPQIKTVKQVRAIVFPLLSSISCCRPSVS